MRPRGEIRRALRRSAEALGVATWRELATHACVGYQAARHTVQSMCKAGELERAGTKAVPKARRPMLLVRVAQPKPADTTPGPADLAAAMHTWPAQRQTEDAGETP